MENQSKKAFKKTIKIIVIVALIWNLMGVFAYLYQVYSTDEAKVLRPQAEKNFLPHAPD
jgi:flagellar basal body-associated protein FliL